MGGDGNDIFAIGQTAGLERIEDFQNGKDRLGLLEMLEFSNLTIVQDRNNVLISVGDDLLAIVKKVTVANITAADFVKL